jgi:hypothetical protein
MGSHVLPGVLCVVLASLLLCWWELRRLTAGDTKAMRAWALPVAGIALSIISAEFIITRFLTVN